MRAEQLGPLLAPVIIGIAFAAFYVARKWWQERRR